jgi:hypothetical protein
MGTAVYDTTEIEFDDDYYVDDGISLKSLLH